MAKKVKALGGKNTDTRTWADFWKVTLQTIRNWRREHVPFKDPKAMGVWALTQGRLPEEVRKKLAELDRAAAPASSRAKGKQGTIFDEDPDWADYQKAKGATAKSADAAATDTLEEHRGLYAFKLQRATMRGDQPQAKFFTEQLIIFDKAIRENKLLADRLGIQSGETITREDSERWFRAWAFWTMRSFDLMLSDLVPQISALAPSITSEQARKAVEPALLEARMFRPFVQATKVASKSSLPSWAVEVVIDSVDDYIERGAELFAAQLAMAPKKKRKA